MRDVFFEGGLQWAARPAAPSSAAPRPGRAPRSCEEHNETHRRGEAGTSRTLAGTIGLEPATSDSDSLSGPRPVRGEPSRMHTL